MAIANNDRLDGGEGNDDLFGLSGNDTLRGGGGDDSINGGADFDILRESGNTNFTLTNGSLTGLGSDTLFGIERVELTGGSGANNFNASGFNVGSVVLVGLAGDDRLTGGAQADTLNGGLNNDTLLGFGGDDLLLGAQGNDNLRGGLGADTLTGGSGNDFFIFNTNAPFNAATIGRDDITDFVVGLDKIVLDTTTFVALASLSNLAGNFAIVTSNAAAATRSARIVYNSSNGNLLYNPNGAAAGFGGGGAFARLTNIPSLGVADFILEA